MYRQDRVNTFFRTIADQIGATYLDEAAITYEAARLARHPVVVVYWFDSDDRFMIVKGDADVLRFLTGESSTLPGLVAFASSDGNAARALTEAFKRRDRKPALRLVS